MSSGWYYLVEPDQGRHAPAARRLGTDPVLTVRHHGHAGRVEVTDPSRKYTVAALLRAARWLGEQAGGPSRLRLDKGPTRIEGEELVIDAAELAVPSPWVLEQRPLPTPPDRTAAGTLPDKPVARALFFESLMNAELPHNDQELSQGVLHMISSLQGTEVVLANVKMSIVGDERPVLGLDQLEAALAGGPVGLVCITLLEGYWPGVISLVRELRSLGCKGHIALGGVMPTLSPEHVAAHFPDVSFVCRGAGEYFVPRLTKIIGDTTVEQPWKEGQISAFLAMDGLIVVDRAGGRLISANSAHTVQVEELDKVPLDLQWITRRHLQTGVELSTSRGCLHRCTFCSIIGRESYQARSADGIFSLLQRYDAHFVSLYGDGPRDRRGRLLHAPRNAWRVHISDDDFACDRERVLSFFRTLPSTPFRLSSCQVSIADLCNRKNGVLLEEADQALLDVIRPDCFDDAGIPLPARDFVVDHKTRAWSSYLQIGVESFSDTELARLGKGYKRSHVRIIVAELARRGIHHDAYFILSNADTSMADLIEVLDEVVRLKLSAPLHFHIRFPVVPFLVSYFSSASYRRRLRQGLVSDCHLRDHVSIEGFPEFDYPFVDHDHPRDPLVADAVTAGFFTDLHFYGGSYQRLRERLLAQAADPEAAYWARVVDDRLRRQIFALLDEARRQTRDSRPEAETRIRTVAESALGPIEGWLRPFKRHTQGGVTRLVVIPTWQCELRCNYCYIPKQDGREMSRETLERSIDLLLSSDRHELTLQFFGGEALLRWDLVKHGIRWGSAQAARRGKRLSFVLSSNGWSLDEEKLEWLKSWPVKLELSLDGNPETQRQNRPARIRGEDSYQHSIAAHAPAILASGLRYDVIMVLHPSQVGRLAELYLHIVSLGFTRIQINYALGKNWTEQHRQLIAEQLFVLAGALRDRPEVVLVNAEERPMAMRLNAEVTVDWDGTIYGGNAFLHETEHKQRFRLGHLDDLQAFDRYWMDAPRNEELVAWSYPPEITANNLKIGAVMTDFLHWWRQERGLG